MILAFRVLLHAITVPIKQHVLLVPNIFIKADLVVFHVPQTAYYAKTQQAAQNVSPDISWTQPTALFAP